MKSEKKITKETYLQKYSSELRLRGMGYHQTYDVVNRLFRGSCDKYRLERVTLEQIRNEIQMNKNMWGDKNMSVNIVWTRKEDTRRHIAPKDTRMESPE